ncbi:MAG: polysaccharide pyruvyl transferase family protein [Planctomycetes bacterium]|jgi:colanic acid/amylovoran biosynthesis protein|nr:polysaccharide pyruvyl transferase family protein [Planctomycetota bacterium]
MKRVFIHPSSLHLANLGDVAMLEVALDRLRRRIPDACFEILARHPRAVRTIRPDATWIPEADRDFLLGAGLYPRALPQGPQRRLKARRPALFLTLWMLKARLLRGRYLGALDLLHRLGRADLFVLTGAGLIADPFRPAAIRALDTLALALDRGVPGVLLGQGLGPLEEPELRRRASEVLPRVDLIFVREALHSVPLLASLGVRGERIVVTGDDALALAVSEPAREGRSAIGANLRLAPYSGISEALAAAVRRVLHAGARELGAPLVGLPIGGGEPDDDLPVLRRLLDGAGSEAASGAPPLTPAEAISRVGLCRVVVTGSYHAAVFALGQGIPVVSIAGSDYYRFKFEGLADLFPRGCRVVDAAEGEFEGDLAVALRRSWADGPGIAAGLRAAAAARVASAEAAFDRISALLCRH